MAALTKITDEELLKKVKSLIGASSYDDEPIELLIEDVKNELLDAGVHEVAVNSRVAIGVIARGVDDLWSLGSGTVNLSPYFKQREAQLALCYPKSDDLKHESEG